MQFLQEKTSTDGNATAKIYDDEGQYYVEYWVGGVHQYSRNYNLPLNEVVSTASNWAGSVQQLNG